MVIIASNLKANVEDWEALLRIKVDVTIDKKRFKDKEPNIFINLLHLDFKPPIPHLTLILKPTLFLLWLSPRSENPNMKKKLWKVTLVFGFWNPNMKP
jgi:hypothetical protein